MEESRIFATFATDKARPDSRRKKGEEKGQTRRKARPSRLAGKKGGKTPREMGGHMPWKPFLPPSPRREMGRE